MKKEGPASFIIRQISSLFQLPLNATIRYAKSAFIQKL